MISVVTAGGGGCGAGTGGVADVIPFDAHLPRGLVTGGSGVASGSVPFPASVYTAGSVPFARPFDVPSLPPPLLGGLGGIFAGAAVLRTLFGSGTPPHLSSAGAPPPLVLFGDRGGSTWSLPVSAAFVLGLLDGFLVAASFLVLGSTMQRSRICRVRLPPIRTAQRATAVHWGLHARLQMNSCKRST